MFIGDNQRIVIENGATLRLGGVTTKYTNADIQVNPGGTLIILPPILKESLNNDKIVNSQMPSEHQLLGNFPNPFNPTTKIKYSLPKESSVELKIFDLLGREVKTFTISSQPAGYYEIMWEGRNKYGEAVSSGVYIIMRFKAIGSNQLSEKSAKLVLTK